MGRGLHGVMNSICVMYIYGDIKYVRNRKNKRKFQILIPKL
jgi:hypothetical protein